MKIYEVAPINWEDSSRTQLSWIGDEEVISLSHAKEGLRFEILYYASER